MTSAETPAKPTLSPIPTWQRVFIGLPMVAIGGFVAVFMSISVILEIRTDDFFGMCVAGLVALGGGALCYEGCLKVMGIKRQHFMATLSSYHRPAYARAAGYPKGMPPDAGRCAEAVFEDWQCPSPKGHGPERAFCTKHALARERADLAG